MVIELKDMVFCYPETNHTPVLTVDTWSVSAEETVFLHGPSGCGKSTLLNLVSGILLPSQGTVSVFGERLDLMTASKRDKFRADNIGYVFQKFNLIPYLNAIENIKLARYFSTNKHNNPSSNEITTLLSNLNISQNDWFKPAAQLSIGQQQRIAISRALINKPRLLIVDEPTSSLDQTNRDNFMELLLSLVEKHDITLVFVSHDISLSKYFNRIDSLTEINSLNNT